MCVDTSAYMLEKALKHETITPIPLITALYFLETAIYFELYEPNQYQHKNGDGMDLSVGETGVAPVALLKNTG